MTREEASKQIEDILKYFEDRIEREIDPAFDKEIAKKDAEALRMAIKELKQEPCDDCISRSEAIRIASGYCHWSRIPEELAKLPSVKPKERIGEWQQDMDGTYLCSECGSGYKDQPTLMGKPMFAFCPICGARMVESEDKG